MDKVYGVRQKSTTEGIRCTHTWPVRNPLVTVGVVFVKYSKCRGWKKLT